MEFTFLGKTTKVRRPYYKKLQGSKLDWNNAISMPLFRLAEVYMIYAEKSD